VRFAPRSEQSVKSALVALMPSMRDPSSVAPEKRAPSACPPRVSWRAAARPLVSWGTAITPSRKSAWVRLASERSAPCRQVPRMSARTSRARVRSAPRRSQPNRTARSSRAPAMLQFCRTEPEKSASSRMRCAMLTPVRSTNFSDSLRPPGFPATNRSWAAANRSKSPWPRRRRLIVMRMPPPVQGRGPRSGSRRRNRRAGSARHAGSRVSGRRGPAPPV
jgi:hypothetical protein